MVHGAAHVARADITQGGWKTMKYCMILGNGFEEVEALAPLDLLRRAGVEVETCGVGGEWITGRTRVPLKADRVFLKRSDIDVGEYAGILLPGGPGAGELVANDALIDVVQAFQAGGKLIFAICAAPRILDRAGLLQGRRYTCFPAARAEIQSGEYCEESVVVDGNIITSRGMGTAIDAGLKLVELIVSPEEARLQAERVVYPYYQYSGRHDLEHEPTNRPD